MPWNKKNRIVSSLRRIRTGSQRKTDIEYDMRNMNFRCKFCGEKLYPYKQDTAGNIIMACPRWGCRGSASMADSPMNRIDKLWIHYVNEQLVHKQWMDDYGVINRYG